MRVRPVRERSQIVEAKQEACEHARELGFDDDTADRVAIVTTEGATNFIRHAGAGDILFGCQAHASHRYDVIFIDSGPGISRPERALEDGYSTAGGLGQGLGAMRRLSDSFDIYSRDGGGVTVATAFFRDSGSRPPRALHEAGPAPAGLSTAGFSVDGFAVPMPGQVSCGDGWCFREDGRRLRFLMCDGLGHGHGANAAMAAAVRTFAASEADRLEDVIAELDEGLRGTRGAAALLIEVPRKNANPVTAIGLGNISAELMSRERVRRIVSHDGILGRGLRRSKVLSYGDTPWILIVVCSDGLRHRWNFADYPGLAAREPMTIAATLWRDFRRGTDDSAIAVIKARAR